MSFIARIMKDNLIDDLNKIGALIPMELNNFYYLDYRKCSEELFVERDSQLKKYLLENNIDVVNSNIDRSLFKVGVDYPNSIFWESKYVSIKEPLVYVSKAFPKEDIMFFIKNSMDKEWDMTYYRNGKEIIEVLDNVNPKNILKSYHNKMLIQIPFLEKSEDDLDKENKNYHFFSFYVDQECVSEKDNGRFEIVLDRKWINLYESGEEFTITSYELREGYLNAKEEFQRKMKEKNEEKELIEDVDDIEVNFDDIFSN